MQIFSLSVVILWMVVSVKTIQQTINGTLLFSPCVKKYQEGHAGENLTEVEDV